ncbi:unnamed protein product [Thlaspi arvense]|uniref:Serine carboxypeptidase n=1 Tax=Thlaspi arvense TaxID=13288 RepID=A0AAU9R9W2_THLAR|nr:unnamed protein product [Thlaspi arvense]
MEVASIILLDQPVGTGFSYSTTPLADKPSDTGEVKQTYKFLQKWLVDHPEYVSNPLYVGGDSYSGIVVPTIGYVLGNPQTDFDSDCNHRIPYAHGMGLISDELFESLKISCEGNYVKVDPSNTQCLKLVEEYDKTYQYLLATNWANDKDVGRALHVVKGNIEKWVRCDLDLAYEKDIKNSVPYHRNNSIKGLYRSLIYSGDHDMFAPFLGTQAWIRSLNYSIIDQWRPWFVNNQVVGYTRTYANNMTFATIKASSLLLWDLIRCFLYNLIEGGHTAEYKPEESFMMFQRWISGQPL